MHSVNIACPKCRKVKGGYRLEKNQLFECQICGEELKFLGVSDNCKVVGVCEPSLIKYKSKDWYISSLSEMWHELEVMATKVKVQTNWHTKDRKRMQVKLDLIISELRWLEQEVEEIPEKEMPVDKKE